MSTETLVTSKGELLAKIAHGYLASRAVLDTLPAERFALTLASGWTLHDVLAHLDGWEEICIERISALRAGQWRKYSDADTEMTDRSASTSAQARMTILHGDGDFSGRCGPDLVGRERREDASGLEERGNRRGEAARRRAGPRSAPAPGAPSGAGPRLRLCR